MPFSFFPKPPHVKLNAHSQCFTCTPRQPLVCMYTSLTLVIPLRMFIPFPPIIPKPPHPFYKIGIQTGTKLSQQLFHPLQTRPVFLELSVGKASTSNGASPRDLYERHTRGKKKEGGRVRVERDGLGEKGSEERYPLCMTMRRPFN